MKITGVALLLSLAPLHIPAMAQAQSTGTAIDVLENRLCTAFSKADREYTEMLSQDFVQVGPAGSIDDTQIGPSRLEVSSRCRELVVSVHSDAAVATGVVTGMPDMRFLHVWHSEAGRWMLVLAHLTPIAKAADGPPPAGSVSPTVWPTGKTSDERAILDAQRALNETFAAYDADAYEKLTAQGFVRVTIDGATMSRKDFIAATADRTGPPRRAPNHSDSEFAYIVRLRR